MESWVKTKGSQIKAEFTPREMRVRECEMGCPDLAGGLTIFREDLSKIIGISFYVKFNFSRIGGGKCPLSFKSINDITIIWSNYDAGILNEPFPLAVFVKKYYE